MNLEDRIKPLKEKAKSKKVQANGAREMQVASSTSSVQTMLFR